MRPSPLTDWHRRMAASIAAGNPLTPAAPIRASGNHRAAQNDEPEPEPDLDAQVTRAIRAKVEAREAQEMRFALSLQIQHGDA